jgi:DNA-binding SARP family transcriptional activator
VEPLPSGAAGFEFVDKIVGGVVPRQFIPSVEKGVRSQMEQGVLAGYPMTGVRVTLFDGKAHPVDSSDMAFQKAGPGRAAGRGEKASPMLLEPVDEVSILVPDEYVGAVMSDLSGRRGRVLGTEPVGVGRTQIRAEVPSLRSPGTRSTCGRCRTAPGRSPAGTCGTSRCRRTWRPRWPLGGRGARLHNQIARLRQDLGDAEARCVKAAPPGYLVEVATDELDLRQFAAYCATGRQAAARADWAKASAEYTAALALWRGVPLADLPALTADPVVQRLDEERWTALQGRIEADLNLGRHAEAAAELRALTEDQPLREPLHAQLMLALYRNDQRAEALDVFRALTQTLADEAGLEPGVNIRELHERILRDDPTLRLRSDAFSSPTSPTSAAPTSTPTSSPNQLPVDTRLFTGREQETEQLLALARETAEGGRSGTLTISALDGLGGVGKSALAVRIAHRVSSLFPDGQLFIDLRGNVKHREPLAPLAALGQLLRSLDVPQQRIPAELADCSAMLRDRLSGTRTLILLDNAATDTQVRPLLPEAPGCLVLVTSRARLAIEGALSLRLDVLSEAESITLLVAAAGPDRIRPDDPAIAELAELCGQIPLALRIIAARLRHRSALTVADLVAQLRDERGRLGELRDEDRDLADVLNTSYTDLTDDEQRTFRLLGLVPGADVDVHAAAALLDLDPHSTEHLFDLLLDRNLLMEPTPGRYRMHDLVRLFAAEQAEAKEHETEREAALDRLLFWYGETAKAAWRTVEPTRSANASPILDGPVQALEFSSAADALAWYDREAGNLLAAVELLRAAANTAVGLKLVEAITELLHIRASARQWLALTEFGIDCAQREGNAAALGRLTRHQGVALFSLGRHEEAIEAHSAAASISREAGQPSEEAAALVSLTSAYAMTKQVDEAIATGERATALFIRLGKPGRAVGPLINMAAALSIANRNEEALVLVKRAVQLSRDTGDRTDLAFSLGQLAAVMHAMEAYDPEELHATYREALEALRATGNRRNELRALLGYGVFLEEIGHFADSVRILEETDRLGDEIGVPMHDKARNALLRARAAVATPPAPSAPSAP